LTACVTRPRSSAVHAHHPSCVYPSSPVESNHCESNNPEWTTYTTHESSPNQTTQPEPQSARSRPALPQAHHHKIRRHQPADGQQPAANSQQPTTTAPRRTAADRQTSDRHPYAISRCQHQYAKKILSLRYCTTDSARQ
jgi:hypothetical protein